MWNAFVFAQKDSSHLFVDSRHLGKCEVCEQGLAFHKEKLSQQNLLV